MAAVFTTNMLARCATSRSASSTVRRPDARGLVIAFAATISHMTVRAGELALFCWAVIVLAFWILILAAFFI